VILSIDAIFYESFILKS